MPEGAAAPSALFRRRGRVPRQETICPPSAVNANSASDSPPPFLFLRDAGRGRRPFRSLPQAGARTPLGNNFSPVCGQCRQRFRFIAAVPLPPGMPEGAAAPSAFFRRRGRVPRRGAIFCLSGRSDLLSSSISSVPKTSAEGKSLPIHKSPCSAMPSTDFYASRQRGCFLFGEFSHRRKPAAHTISGSVAIDRIVVAAKISDA